MPDDAASSTATSATKKSVSIYSQGVRLAGDLWSPQAATADEERPAILMMHGFGGKKDELNRLYASKFAAAGYYVLTFDYRGFGESDGDLLPVGNFPHHGGDAKEMKVREVRDVVNALNQYQDIEAALLFLKGEPGVDADRIAAWGTSLGGGLALKAAIHHPEIKVLIAQVATVNMRPFYTALPKISPVHADNMEKFQIAVARGDYPFVPEKPFWMEFSAHHKGFAHAVANFIHEPMKNVETLRAATLIIDAEKEELVDTKEQGALLYERIKDKTTARYEVLPGTTHFDVYDKDDVVAAALALELAWLKEHLPPK